MPWLVTGFGAFGEVTRNPSSAILPAVAAAFDGEVEAREVPVSWTAADALVAEVLTDPPELWLALGVAECQTVRLEQTARNLDDCPAPDITGELRRGLPIAPDGPETLPSTLPLAAIEAALRTAGFPVNRSDDAGGYLCNHLFYRMQHAFAALPCRSGFVHVPRLWEAPPAGHSDHEAALSAAVLAILEAC